MSTRERMTIKSSASTSKGAPVSAQTWPHSSVRRLSVAAQARLASPRSQCETQLKMVQVSWTSLRVKAKVRDQPRSDGIGSQLVALRRCLADKLSADAWLEARLDARMNARQDGIWMLALFQICQ